MKPYKKKGSVKVQEKSEQLVNEFAKDNDEDIVHPIAPQPTINFMTNENIIGSSIGISTAMLAALDFEKLYGIDQETDQSAYLNEKFEDESLTTSNFGTIGGERKHRNGIEF